MGDLRGVAVIEQGRHAFAGAEQLLGGLAPARMVDLGVHVGPEAVFGGLDVFLLLASIGTPIFMAMTIMEYVKGPAPGAGADKKA